jgi:hypothetical protein
MKFNIIIFRQILC